MVYTHVPNAFNRKYPRTAFINVFCLPCGIKAETENLRPGYLQKFPGTKKVQTCTFFIFMDNHPSCLTIYEPFNSPFSVECYRLPPSLRFWRRQKSPLDRLPLKTFFSFAFALSSSSACLAAIIPSFVM